MNNFIYPETVECPLCNKTLNVSESKDDRVRYVCFCDRNYIPAPRYSQFRNSHHAKHGYGEVIYYAPHFFMFSMGNLVGYVRDVDPIIFAKSRPMDFINRIIHTSIKADISEFSSLFINKILESNGHEQLSFIEDLPREMVENYFLLF